MFIMPQAALAAVLSMPLLVQTPATNGLNSRTILEQSRPPLSDTLIDYTHVYTDDLLLIAAPQHSYSCRQQHPEGTEGEGNSGAKFAAQRHSDCMRGQQ
jgi:hypothetical protein